MKSRNLTADPMLNKKVLVLLAIALGLRLSYILMQPANPDLSGGDGAGYEALAWNVASGRGFEIFPGIPSILRGPGYPAFLAAIYLLFGHQLRAAFLIQAVVDTLSCWLAYDLARRVFNQHVARIVLAGVAIYPFFISELVTLYQEPVFMFLLLLTTWMLVRYQERHSLKYVAIAGLINGLNALVRPTNLLVAPAYAMLIFTNRGSTKHKLKVGATFVAITALVILPWTLRNYMQVGRCVPVSAFGGVTLWVGSQPYTQGRWPWYAGQLDTPAGRAFAWAYEDACGVSWTSAVDGKALADLDACLAKVAIKNILQHPTTYLTLLTVHVADMWLLPHIGGCGACCTIFCPNALVKGPPLVHLLPLFRLGMYLMQLAFVCLAVLGLVAQRHNMRLLPIWAILLGTGTLYLFTKTEPRYRLPLEPFMIVFAVVGAIQVLSMIRRR